VEDGIRAGQGLAQGLGAGQQVGPQVRGGQVRHRAAVQGEHVVAGGEQLADQGGADEAGGPGHHDWHRVLPRRSA
jgi:hypothetical protein